MNVTLITGFLGAGKTTVLHRLLREAGGEGTLGVIVNDLSELEVDGELLRGVHRVAEANGTLVSLFRGLISSDRRTDFAEALAAMKGRGVEQCLVETSGASHPDAVIEQIFSVPGITPGAVAALVDARMIDLDYAGGPALLEALEQAPSAVEALLADQIRAASVVIVTKIDLIPEHSIRPVFHALMTLNRTAAFAGCAYGKIDPSLLLDAEPYARERLRGNREIPLPGIQTLVIRDPRPLHPRRFYDLYRTRLGIGLYRSKGFIWLVTRPDHVLLWNQAGGAMGMELLAFWKAHMLAADQRLLREEREHLRAQLERAHPVFGDRHCELTLIGQPRDLDGFARGLQDCFCTAGEIQHWQAGGTFEDPWPKSLKLLS